MSTQNLLKDKEQQKSRWDHKADGNQSTFCILVFFTYSGKLPIQILHWRNQKDSYWLHPDLAFLPNQWRSLHLSHHFQIQRGLQWKMTTAKTQEGQEWGFKQSQSSTCPQGWFSQPSEHTKSWRASEQTLQTHNTMKSDLSLTSHLQNKVCLSKTLYSVQVHKKEHSTFHLAGNKGRFILHPYLISPMIRCLSLHIPWKTAGAVLVPPTLANTFSRAWDNFYWPHQIPPLLLEGGRAPQTNPLYVTVPYFCTCNKYLPAQRQCLQYLLLAQTQNLCC